MNFAEIAALPGGTACLTPHYALCVTGGNSLELIFNQDQPPKPAGDRLVLKVPALWGHGSFRFASPKVVSRWDALEFKHYRRNGTKFWTSRLGREHCFAVPLAAIELVAPPADDRIGWGSYPQVTVGGSSFTLNVSGGGGGPDGRWLDHVGPVAGTRCNLPVRTLRAIESMALPEVPVISPADDEPGDW
jgi:hypothetical protein